MAENEGTPVQDTVQATVTVAPTAVTEQAEQKTFSADYVKSIRSEAAEARVQLREAQKAIETLQKSQTDAAELKTQLDALQKDLAEKVAIAEKATKESALIRIAAKAGITDSDILGLIDLSKVDLSDEAKAVALLGKLANTQGVAQAKPGAVTGTGMSADELRERYWGSGNRTTIFGG